MALDKLYGSLNIERCIFINLFVKGRYNTYMGGQKGYVKVLNGDINCPKE